MKIFKASISIYMNHIVTAMASLFLGLAFHEIAKERPFLFSFITTLIYVVAMYMATWRVGRRDGRNIPGFVPDKMMPVRLSLIVTAVPFVLLVLSIALPDTAVYESLRESDFILSGCRVRGIFDVLYRAWYFHFAAFVPCGNLFAYIAELFVLPVIIFAGYYVGVSKFSISEWLYSKIVFTDKRNK